MFQTVVKIAEKLFLLWKYKKKFQLIMILLIIVKIQWIQTISYKNFMCMWKNSEAPINPW